MYLDPEMTSFNTHHAYRRHSSRGDRSRPPRNTTASGPCPRYGSNCGSGPWLPFWNPRSSKLGIITNHLAAITCFISQTVLTISELKNKPQPFCNRFICFAIFKNVVHSLESGETPSNSASHQAPNYVQSSLIQQNVVRKRWHFNIPVPHRNRK